PICPDGCGPGVYRFICPDGRSYVGSRRWLERRKRIGMQPSNKRLQSILVKYPSEMWTFEIIELIPWRMYTRPLGNTYEREQYHIERLRSWDPAHGFNMEAACWRTASDEFVTAVADHPELAGTFMGRRAVRERERRAP